MPIDLWIDELSDGQRGAAEAVLSVLEKIRGLVIEAVGVGVLVKRGRTIIELRPDARSSKATRARRASRTASIATCCSSTRAVSSSATTMTPVAASARASTAPARGRSWALG
jgi:hypothetical protein